MRKTVNQKYLAKEISIATDFSISEVEDIVKSLLVEMVTEMKAGNRVRLSSFGTFEIKNRKERKGVNPRNLLEKINIPATNCMKFTASRPLKDEINNR